ncbi:MAG: hypothetical protein EKK44_17050 [Methylobacterium sp.]|nr:MAG: hypothetical protein EKK44_17050 [Methylobacterium sp.]
MSAAASGPAAGPLSRAGEGQGEGCGLTEKVSTSAERRRGARSCYFSSLTPALSHPGEGVRRASSPAPVPARDARSRLLVRHGPPHARRPAAAMPGGPSCLTERRDPGAPPISR